MKRLRVIFRILLVTLIILTIFPIRTNAQTQFSRTNVPGQITITTAANVRSGPGTSFLKVGSVYQGQTVECLGKLGNWWVVHLQNDVVGAISGSLAKAYYPPSQPAHLLLLPLQHLHRLPALLQHLHLHRPNSLPINNICLT